MVIFSLTMTTGLNIPIVKYTDRHLTGGAYRGGTELANEQPTPNEAELRLLDCALTLFAEKGYAGASVREIIEAAGVTRPVLYYYCDNKEHLFRRVITATHEQAYRVMDAVLSSPGTCADRLRTIIRGSFVFCARDPRIPQIMFQVHFSQQGGQAGSLVAAHTARRFDIVTQIMREGLAAGELAGGDPESLALVFCCLMDQHIMALAGLPNPEGRLTCQLADALVDVFFHGVGVGERGRMTLPPFAAHRDA